MSEAKIAIRANASQAVSEFDRLKARAAGSFQSIREEAAGLRSTMGTLAGVAVVGAFVGMAKGALDAGDEINKLSQRTGISAENLSQLQYAAKLADVNTQDLAKGVRALNLSIAEGLAGDKQKLANFKALGIELRDARGQVKATEQVLLEMADAYAKSADGPTKIANANALLAKAGEQMIPLLNGGSDAIRAMKAEADALGLTISTDFAQQAEQFNDSITKLTAGVQGVSLELTREMLPALQAVIGEMTAARTATGEVGDSIAAKIGGGVRVAIEAVSVLAANVSFVLQGVGREIGALWAQAAALARLDFKGFSAISDAVREDGERARKELDALERRLMGLGDPAAAGGGRGSVNPPLANPDGGSGGKPAIAAVGTAAKTAESEYSKMVQRIQERIAASKQELALGRELTEQEKFAAKALADVDAAKGKLTATERARVLALVNEASAEATAVEQQRKALKERTEAMAEHLRDRRAAFLEEHDANVKRDESARLMLEQIEFETKLLGMNTAEREKALAMRELERQGIKEGTKAWEEYAEKIRNATQRRVDKEKQVDQAKAVAEEWKKVGDDIYSSLTDSLYRAFEEGQGFSENFWNSLKNTAKATVLRVAVQYVTGGMSGGGAGGGGGMLQSIAGMFGGGGQGGAAGGSGGGFSMNSVLNLGSQFIGGSALTSGIGSVAGAMGFTNFAAGITGTAAGTAAAGTAGAALGAGAAAAIPYIGWAIAIASLLSGNFKGETRHGAEYSNAAKVRGPSGGEINGDATRQAITSTTSTINQMLRQMGSDLKINTLYSGIESSEKGKGFAYAGARLSDGTIVGQGGPTHADLEAARMNRRGSKSPEQAMAEYGEELQQVMLQTLQAADLPGALGNYLRQLGEIDMLSGGALKAAAERVTRVLNERAQLEARLADLTGTALDRLNAHRKAEREAIDKMNRPLLAVVHAQEDLSAAKGVLAEAYGREGSALQQSIEAHRAYAQNLRDFAQGLMTGNLSTLTRGGRTAAARSYFDATNTAALAGDDAARAKLTGAASDYLGTLMGSARNQTEYRIGFARVQAALAMNAAGAESTATIEEQRLAQMKEQATALGLVNDELLTFAQALAKVNAAQAKLDAAKAAKAIADGSYIAGPKSDRAEWEKEFGGDPAKLGQALNMRRQGYTLVQVKGMFDRLDKFQNSAPTSGSDSGPGTGSGSGGGDSGTGGTSGGDGSAGVGAFAMGGMHRGGARLVGERGPELEVTGPARIYSTEKTRELLGVGNDSALLDELRALRRQMENQQRAIEAVAIKSANTASYLNEFRTRGMPVRNAEGQQALTVETAE